MRSVGVPLVPGHEVSSTKIKDIHEELINVSSNLGFPLLLKASAGGGGKGPGVSRAQATTGGGPRAEKTEANPSANPRTLLLEALKELLGGEQVRGSVRSVSVSAPWEGVPAH